jgi:hypothetical protein
MSYSTSNYWTPLRLIYLYYVKLKNLDDQRSRYVMATLWCVFYKYNNPCHTWGICDLSKLMVENHQKKKTYGWNLKDNATVFKDKFLLIFRMRWIGIFLISLCCLFWLLLFSLFKMHRVCRALLAWCALVVFKLNWCASLFCAGSCSLVSCKGISYPLLLYLFFL